jgi:hypothetical protein
MKWEYWITNGQLGSLDNTKVAYSIHPNGRRALQNAIQAHANRTGLESWAIPTTEPISTPRRWYPKRPQY